MTNWDDGSGGEVFINFSGVNKLQNSCENVFYTFIDKWKLTP